MGRTSGGASSDDVALQAPYYLHKAPPATINTTTTRIEQKREAPQPTPTRVSSQRRRRTRGENTQKKKPAFGRLPCLSRATRRLCPSSVLKRHTDTQDTQQLSIDYTTQRRARRTLLGGKEGMETLALEIVQLAGNRVSCGVRCVDVTPPSRVYSTLARPPEAPSLLFFHCLLSPLIVSTTGSSSAWLSVSKSRGHGWDERQKEETVLPLVGDSIHKAYSRGILVKEPSAS